MTDIEFLGAFILLGCVLTMLILSIFKGKTTLQYTIVDGVKVDSVVVWKIKEE